jgi:hypothetical protein
MFVTMKQLSAGDLASILDLVHALGDVDDPTNSSTCPSKESWISFLAPSLP